MTEDAETGKNNAPKRRVGDGTPGPGRPKGKSNKLTMDIKQAILRGTELAGAKVGGKEDAATYFAWLAENNSSAHAGLVAKIIPQAGPNDDGSHKVVHEIIRKIVEPGSE